ncbi:MAG: PIG-L family deacetylase [Magnetococcales bacterium]|nr:PIG-L family deacetylase [Magnetococcales bacterium]
MIKKNDRLLCFSPHPDDTEFGLGGLLHRFRDDIEYLIVVFSDRSQTRGELNNDRDQFRAAQLLGAAEDQVLFVDQLPDSSFQRLPIQLFANEDNRGQIRQILSTAVKMFKPTTIFVPSKNETMQDHQAIGEEAVRILRGEYSIYGYEVPKHNRLFQPNAFVQLEQADVNAKVSALQCYSEFTTDYYFEQKVLESLACVRALHAGFFGYAEAFEVYRIFVSNKQ